MTDRQRLDATDGIVELWPDPRPVTDPYEANFALKRRRADGAPWVVMVMISTLDGAAELDGLSGGLGAPSDKAVFGSMRAIADAIVVAGGTARDENYGPPLLRKNVVEARRSRSQSDVARLAVLSASLNFDPSARLFERSPDGSAPVIYTVASNEPAHQGRAESLVDLAEVVALDEVTPQSVVADLASRGAHLVVLEGGPSLNGQFLAADLVDEIHLSLAPLAVGGDAIRIARGAAVPDPRRFALSRLWSGDGILFASYHRSTA